VKFHNKNKKQEKSPKPSSRFINKKQKAPIKITHPKQKNQKRKRNH
jgi:hypothetical protein